MKLLIALLFFQLAFANESTSTMEAPKALPKFKATFDSYYYDFKGERPAQSGLFDFGNTTLKMQFFALQYQLSPSWTLMGIAQHYENSVITNVTGFGSSKDSSQGIADFLVSGVHMQLLSPSVILLTDVGLSLPTGSIDEKNPVDTTGRKNYPYNMQLGSGTLDQTLGVTALWLQPGLQVGGRFATILRTSGFNENGYRLGHQFKTDAWVDIPVANTGLTPRVVGYYKHRNRIKGQDSTLRNPFERPYLEYYYHDQINWDVSVALQYKKDFTPAVGFKAEVGVPMAQDTINYDDVAIFTEYYGTLGVTGSF